MLTSPTRSLKTLAWLARMALGLVVAAWFLFGASWAALHWVIVPRIVEWQPALERLASQRLGVDVRIGRIELDDSSALPSLTLHNVQLLDRDARAALQLGRVHAALSVSSVWRLGFDQLVIDSPIIDIRRTASGQWQIGGFEMVAQTDQDPQGRSPVLNWVLSQKELAILNGRLRYVDDMLPQTTALELTDIRWVNRHRSQAVEMRLDARLPDGWGETISIQGDFTYPFWQRHVGDWQLWKGQWFADLPGVDLRQLPAYANTTAALGMQLLEGAGSARAWADLIEGQLRNITIDTNLHAAALQWPGQTQPMALRALSGRLHLDRHGQTIQLATENLAFTTREGAVWPGGNFRYSQRLDNNNALDRMRFESNDLDALALIQLTQDMPLPSSWQTQLRQLAPQGRIEQLDVSWSQHNGGDALVRLAGVSLNTEPWFDDQPRMQFDQVQGRMLWSHGNGLRVEGRDLRAHNTDLQAGATMLWTQDTEQANHPGHLQLDVAIDHIQANRLYRYLPKTLGPNVLRYLKTSIQEGQAFNGKIAIEGDLAHFPFDRHPGRFEIGAQLRDVLFDYAPTYLLPRASAGWPRLLVKEGRLLINPQNIDIRDAKAQLAHLPQVTLPLTQGTVQGYLGQTPVVQVRGPVQGPANDILAFIQGSALDGMLNRALANATVSGPLQGEIDLALPLYNTQATTIKGQVVFNNNTLRIRPDIPVLTQTQGTLRFSEVGFEIQQAKAMALGGPTTIDARLHGEGAQRSLTVQAKGRAGAQGLTQDSALSAFSSITQHLQGQSDYNVLWRQQGKVNRFVLDSSLQGMAIDLPSPFLKASAGRVPLLIEMSSIPNSRTSRDQVVLQLGDASAPQLAARYLREERQGQMQVVRGAVGVNTRAPSLPSSGVVADIQLNAVDTGPWSKLFEDESAGETSAWAPTSIRLKAGVLQAAGYTLNQLELRANKIISGWDAQVQAQEVEGSVIWAPSTDRLPGRIQARLSRLYLQSGSGDAIDSLIRQDPTHVPAVDIRANDFRLDGRALGQLEMQAINRFVVQTPSHTGHEWRLQTLKLTTPEARLSATGNWAPTPQDPIRRRTALSLTLEIDNAGLLLARFGMPDVVRGGHGKIEGSLGWVGSPLNFNKTTLAGELAIEVNRGQFLQAEPGVARLIGVLNLQSLPRRLSLDFRDVFSEGFAFDFVRGNVQVAAGLARTNNLQMKGVTAAVLIEGEADVLHEKQDLTAIIIPDLSTGTATLVTTIINPITGISAFLGQFLLRQPLQEAATRQFRITGSWDDPKVTPVARRNITQNGGASSSSPSMSAP